QHLLFATRKLRARARTALEQVREELVDLLEAHTVARHDRRQGEIFLDGEAGEDAALLGNEADAGPGDAVQRQAHDRLLLEFHLALALAYDAHDGAQGGGLADTVAAKQRDRLTGVDIEIDAMQRMALAIPGLEVAHLELRRRAATPRS